MQLSDIYHFPLWEKGVHDLLQLHFTELSLVFFGYARIASESDGDITLQMGISGLRDFVDDCLLATREVGFEHFCSTFAKCQTKGKEVARSSEAERARRASRLSGADAKKETELNLQEFVNYLVHLAFQRANSGLAPAGASGKREVVMLPGCLEKMLFEHVLPRARRDTPAQFRETTLRGAEVQETLEQWRDRLMTWFQATIYKDATPGEQLEAAEEKEKAEAAADKLSLSQWLARCKNGSPENPETETPERPPLVGRWSCRRRSDISGDERCSVEYQWKFTLAQAKAAFLDSQQQVCAIRSSEPSIRSTPVSRLACLPCALH